MTNTARDEEIALLLSEARTHMAWQDKPIEDATLKKIYDLARMGPTTANSQPLRVVFVKSVAAKEKLKPVLMPQNVDKTMSAPVTAIIAYDTEFFEKMPKLFPARPEMGAFIKGMGAPVSNGMASTSATLQAAYLIIAARALGVDCGPMGGFDVAKTDAAFFPEGKWKTIMLLNLGYGVPEKLFPRNPRLEFDEACRVE